MDNENLILLALCGIALWMISKNATGQSNTVLNMGKAINGISEIFTGAKQGQYGYGWRYFSDGGAIDPAGNYYLNGDLVWTKP